MTSSIFEWIKQLAFACTNCTSAEEEKKTEHCLKSTDDKEAMILEYENSIY